MKKRNDSKKDSKPRYYFCNILGCKDKPVKDTDRCEKHTKPYKSS